MSIQLTLSEEEIIELGEVVGWKIEYEEDLYHAVLMAINKYVETYKTK